jgi:hypothetical protein
MGNHPFIQSLWFFLEKPKWTAALNKDMKSLYDKKTWEVAWESYLKVSRASLEEFSHMQQAVGCKCVYRVQKGPNDRGRKSSKPGWWPKVSYNQWTTLRFSLR